ncbi:DNA/RNA helicase domain-containing protein [Luteimonas sp. 22616]|uniref:DNA/RNA helicase domain-containing protein n=1 Tax=Luteimonas sp. 22616 TaxID=3453951 RepID=UPI003F85D6E3
MIIYQGTRSGFLHDTDNRDIEDVVSQAYLATTGKYVPHAEIRAWRESLGQMAKVLRDEEMPDDMGVGIEYGIPQTSKRIDFILSGRGADDRPHLIVVELKQWSSSKLSDKDGIVIAQRGGVREREGAHPCYQAWSYAALLEGFNEAVYEGNVGLRPCAYLHNYIDDGIISHPHYAPYMDKAPLFLRGDTERQRLRDFIKQHVRHGDNAELLYRIESGRIRPSKMLADSLGKMLRGNREFVLIDDQKVVHETALALARTASEDAKQVVIVQGGPGTGKSVVAINLLAALTKLGLLTKYVSKNAAPRSVYKARLMGERFRQVEISNLFSGSGAFIETPPNTFDALVVDEAHRLNRFSGLYGNLGENQVKEVIDSAKCTILFVDDDQMVTLSDIGHSTELERWATRLGAQVTRLELASQFRCNGSDGYLAWLDRTLGIRDTANADFDPDAFDFRVVDSPVELHALIAQRNQANNKSRVVAGYCWDWKSRKDPEAYDIVLDEHDYRKQWNLDRDGSLWLIAPDSIDEVGCIHTCQGLELDYVGVIIGPDLLVRDGQLVTSPENRSKQDRSIRGYKKRMKSEPEETRTRLDRIIRNTYRTLMTRGMKGCYVFCTDADTKQYFRRAIGIAASAPE